MSWSDHVYTEHSLSWHWPYSITLDSLQTSLGPTPQARPRLKPKSFGSGCSHTRLAALILINLPVSMV